MSVVKSVFSSQSLHIDSSQAWIHNDCASGCSYLTRHTYPLSNCLDPFGSGGLIGTFVASASYIPEGRLVCLPTAFGFFCRGLQLALFIDSFDLAAYRADRTCAASVN